MYTQKGNVNILKNSLSKKIITGIASVALVAPLVLGGLSASASTTQANDTKQATPNTAKVSQANGTKGKSMSLQQFKSLLKKRQRATIKNTKPVFLRVGKHSVYMTRASKDGRLALAPSTTRYWGSFWKLNHKEHQAAKKYTYAASKFRDTGEARYLVRAYHDLRGLEYYGRVATVPANHQKALKHALHQMLGITSKASHSKHISKKAKQTAKRIHHKLAHHNHKHAHKHADPLV